MQEKKLKAPRPTSCGVRGAKRATLDAFKSVAVAIQIALVFSFPPSHAGVGAKTSAACWQK